MNKFNKTEKKIAHFLSNIPAVKYYAKFLYQFLNYMLYRKRYTNKVSFSIKEVSDKSCESFFGYYDKSPENETGQYIIYHQTRLKTTRKPTTENIQIVVKDVLNNSESIIDESNSYNWQQGTKLQWISDVEFIYNYFDLEKEQYKSKIYNINKRKIEKVLGLPIYDCYKNEYALSLNFTRLIQLRPDYGYRNIKMIDLKDHENDGIYYIDIEKNSSFLLIPLQKIIDISPKDSMRTAKHKINHIMISPDGSKFIFLHRWYTTNGKRYDRLLLSEKNGKYIRVLVDNDMVSHCCWYGNNSIIGYFRHTSHNDSFYIIDVKTANVRLLSNHLQLLGDGHPTVINNSMVFDSYPDRSRMKKLYIYSIDKDSLRVIGEFIEPLKYFGETRCDLHPKWNYNGSKIFIDSVHEGKRKLYEINLGS